MAKLGSFYGLCPLIDSKSLLGISEDSEKGVVIITLGKNVACRYKLSDQKQISSWKTKEKFSSPVVYDIKYSSYAAVFNQCSIKLWNADEENLDKIKKYKFNKQIYSVIPDKENTYVLFQTGAIYTLTDALEMRKNLNLESILSDMEQIDDILYKTIGDVLYVGLIIKTSNECYLYWTKNDATKYKYSKIKLFKDGYTLKGYVFHNEGVNVSLLTLWSDGRIYSYRLETDEIIIQGELFTAVEHISTKYSVSILSLDENYIVMFGANCNEEGAILMIYNTQFKVIQSTQTFKLFTNGAKLWCIEYNLLLPVGQNLAVIPFYLETEQLAALVGSHKTVQTERDDITLIQEIETVSWNSKSALKEMQLIKKVTCKISEHLKQGIPEGSIIGEILPNIFNQHDIECLSIIINYFSDIPEKYLAKILKYLITVERTHFSDQKEHSSKLFPFSLQPLARSKLIDIVFCKPFSEILLLPHLRVELTLNDVLLLIKYIYFLWSDDGHIFSSLNMIKTETKLINWSYILIDSNYQQILLSKNDSVINALNQLLMLINENLDSFEDIKLLSTLIAHHKNKEYKVPNVSLKYSVEQVNLY